MKKRRIFAVVVSFVVAGIVGLPGAESTDNSDATEPEEASSDVIITKKDAVDLVKDANLDDAIQRRPDLTFRHVTVNQDKSSLSLSEIPSQAVEKAEVMKAVTPDLDADTRGGSLNVKIKPAYEIKKPVLKGKVYTRYKTIYDSFGSIGTVTWAGPVGKDSGLRITGEYQGIVRGSDELRFDWSDAPAATTNAFVLNGADMLNSDRNYDTYRLNGSFDHRFSPAAMIYIRANWDRSNHEGTSSAVQYRYGDEADFDELTPDAGRVSGARVRREGRFWENKEDTFSYTLGGELELPDVHVDWRAQRTEERDDTPVREVVRFDDNDATIGYEGARTNFPSLIDPNRDDGTRFFLSGYDSADEIETLTTDVGAVDATWKPDWTGERGYIKAGLKYSRNDLNIATRTDVFQIATAEPPDLSGFIDDSRRSDFIGRGYEPGITPDASAVSEYIGANPDVVARDALLSALRTAPASYDSREAISAGYLMANLYTGPWRFLVGGRYEHTALDSAGSEVIVDGTDFEVKRREASNRYGHFFPGVHARYRWSPMLDIIGSYTQTVRRPDFDDTAPFRIVETDERSIREGNPDARAMIYDNFDLAFDIEPTAHALVSWEWFYRSVSDSLFTRTSTLEDGPFAGYRVERIENGGDSSVWGSKLSYQQKLEAVSPKLAPFSWNIAYTYNESNAEYPERPVESLPLAGLSRHDIQAALSFTSDKIYIQLGLDFESRALARVSGVGPEKDIYSSDLYFINLIAEYKVDPVWTVFLDWENLNRNFEHASGEGTGSRPFLYKWDPWKILFGVRFER